MSGGVVEELGRFACRTAKTVRMLLSANGTLFTNMLDAYLDIGLCENLERPMITLKRFEGIMVTEAGPVCLLRVIVNGSDEKSIFKHIQSQDFFDRCARATP